MPELNTIRDLERAVEKLVGDDGDSCVDVHCMWSGQFQLTCRVTEGDDQFGASMEQIRHTHEPERRTLEAVYAAMERMVRDE